MSCEVGSLDCDVSAGQAPMHAKAAMHFIPVKMARMVQFLVCFGIIFSTVSVTRSVVQSNLMKINAQLQHIQGPSDDFDADSALPNVFDGYASSMELDDTALKGYIVSNKEQRYNNSKAALEKLGIQAHQYVPLSYKSDAIQKAMEEFHGGDQRYLTDRYKKVFSNRMAFTDLFQKFVTDPDAELGSWRFFFEDDVALHPFLTHSIAREVLARGLEVAAGDGILYLGICGPRQCQDRVVLSSPVEAMRCSGACTHAFGLTKWKTGGFLSYMDKLRMPDNVNVSSMYFDQLMLTYGEQVHRIWVLGSNLRSPVERNHFGLVFQDRTNYPSVINTPGGA